MTLPARGYRSSAVGNLCKSIKLYIHMLLFKAKNIEFPEYHKVYSIPQLGNFIDYEGRKMTASASFRLKCLMAELDIHGMEHPIILSPTIAYSVSVGHQRVWYAKTKGYTHIDCYEVPDQATWEKVYTYTQSHDYWQKYSTSDKHQLPEIS